MTSKAASRASRAGEKRARSGGAIVRAIAALKLAKALLLAGVGLGALNLLSLPSDTAQKLYAWACIVAWRVGPRAGSAVEQKLSTLDESQLTVVAIVALSYGALFGVEGVGLWMKKRWAEFLTIIATASFLPIEVYELIRRATWQCGATLAVNLFVVGYLIWKVRQKE
jgi:uncharacterized membrane protein (DUF2068 family)